MPTYQFRSHLTANTVRLNYQGTLATIV